MFFRKPPANSSSSPPKHRLEQLVRETRDRPASLSSEESVLTGGEPEVLPLLVDLRAAGKRGYEAAAAQKLGPEFSRYLGAFYNLASELQPSALEALLRSRRLERESDTDGAVRACEVGLQACADYLPLLERLATLESGRGNAPRAEQWYSRLLAELDRLNFYPNALEICRRLVDAGARDMDLLERCGRRLEAEEDMAYAARCFATRAANLVAEGRDEVAVGEFEHAVSLQPDAAHLHLELAVIYERLGEVDRVAYEVDQAEALAVDDPETLVRVLLIRGRLSPPDEAALNRLMDQLEARPQARAACLARCAEAVAESPHNPHLCYIQGLLLAHSGKFEPGIEALRIAADRYNAQSDRASELDVRLALRQLATRDEDNSKRIAELYFERGEVKLAMQTLASLAQALGGSPGLGRPGRGRA